MPHHLPRYAAQLRLDDGQAAPCAPTLWLTRGAMMRVTRNSIMKQLFVALCALTLVAASTPAFAQRGHGMGHGMGRGPGIGAQSSPFAGNGMRALQNRIPAPLPAPAQPPVIN